MAKVFKRSGSDFFYGRFKVDGKEIWFSTKCTDRKQAQAVADGKAHAARGKVNTDDYFTGLVALLARLPQDDQDAKCVEYTHRLMQTTRGKVNTNDYFTGLTTLLTRLPEKDQDAKRHDYARQLMQGQSSTLKIADAWQTWIDTPLKGNPGPATIRAYSGTWKRFSKWIAKRPVKYLHEITETHAQDYISDLWKSKVSPRTFNGHTKFLKSMFHVLRVKAGLLANAWDNIKSMDRQTQSRQNFTPEELAAICSKAQGAIRYMIGIGLYTGLRMGDVVNLKWANIGKDSIVLIPAKTKHKGKQITLPIHPVLRVLLDELHTQAAGQEYLFPAEHGRYQNNDGTISKIFQNFLKDCGIVTTEPAGDHRRQVIVRKGFHSLRHSFVSLCAANRVPQVAIQELVGHGSPAMTALYSHADFTQKQDAINGLPAMVFEKQ